jgi:tetratricopeptide (TPR) repeat protein
MAEVQQKKISSLEKRVGDGGKSPLFAQLASFYIQEGKAKEALRLCDEGLAVFPHYTTGHLIKGKALLALKMNAEARREFEIVGDFLPANETVAFILSNIQPGEGETLASSGGESAASSPAEEASSSTATVGEPAPSEDSAPPTAVPEMPEPKEPANLFEAVGQTPEVVDDPFGFGSELGTENAPPTETPTAESSPNPFDGFPGQPEPQTTPEGFLTSGESQSASIFDFPFQSQEGPAVVPGEETFEVYAARMRGELGGGENAMTLEEYLNTASHGQTSTQQEPISSSSETIEDLAEKLQSAKKITPVINLSTKATIPASETDSPASTGFVTPTLAEIYAKQGWYDDAIKAYRMLCINKPAEKDRFEKRIGELEELKKQQG